MNRTYADLRPGARLDIDVEFITKRTVDCEGTKISRLLVTDRADKQFAVLVASGPDSLPDLETGATYHVSGLLGARSVDSARSSAEKCPDCGGRLRVGRVVDTADSAVAVAASQLDLDEPFGIVDATSSMQATADGAV